MTCFQLGRPMELRSGLLISGRFSMYIFVLCNSPCCGVWNKEEFEFGFYMGCVCVRTLELGLNQLSGAIMPGNFFLGIFSLSTVSHLPINISNDYPIFTEDGAAQLPNPKSAASRAPRPLSCRIYTPSC